MNQHRREHVEDATEVANIFGKYVSTIVKNQLNTHFSGRPAAECTASCYIRNSIFFLAVNEAEIKSTIISMLNKKSSGFNDITTKMMKFVLDTE